MVRHAEQPDDDARQARFAGRAGLLPGQRDPRLQPRRPRQPAACRLCELRRALLDSLQRSKSGRERIRRPIACASCSHLRTTAARSCGSSIACCISGSATATLFDAGTYVPLKANGSRSRHVLAFARLHGEPRPDRGRGTPVRIDHRREAAAARRDGLARHGAGRQGRSARNRRYRLLSGATFQSDQTRGRWRACSSTFPVRCLRGDARA